jgi:dolichyl-phosphate-mannose--protein O-mannosyl transferase
MPLNLKRRIFTFCSVFCLLTLLIVQVVVAIRGQSLTWDEGNHIFSGVEIWHTHDYSFNPEHPPMVKMLGALALMPLPIRIPQPQGRFFKAEAYLDGTELLFHNAPQFPAERLIFRARIVEIIFSLATALVVFAAAAEMFSLEAGLCALLLFCFEPTLVTHSAYVTTDMAASGTIFATIYALWRWTV